MSVCCVVLCCVCVDQIIHTMGQYNIKISALQETKWFGSNVYRVAVAVLLTSDSNVPPSNEAMQRGEGVVLILLGDAIFSWEAGGKQWISWSARIVLACFKIGEKQHDFLHVVSCYAPTWGSSKG